MRILVINGPNLNMLGIREKNVYGSRTYEDLCTYIKNEAEKLNVEVELFQSNHEGAIIDEIHKAYQKFDGIIINPGAYTHYSYAIYDALKCVNIKTIEVHISNIHEREEFRRISVIKDACVNQISGHGFAGYKLALEELVLESRE
ncbi:MAG: type II 3-dehydroquinate dehydratase [Clostridiaceae bacterium]|nr:type II 3-dehydroquinate dehydratase [Clostridiaceae bacterium]